MRGKFFLSLILVGSLITSTAYGATGKPTPKPVSSKQKTPPTKSSTVTKKPTVATKKSTTTATTAKPTTSSKKPTITTKKPVKKVVRKYRPRKRVNPIPSPSPKWPPTNFYSDGGGIYLKVALSANELNGVLAAAGEDSELFKDSQTCIKQVCGVMQLASADSCYWEIDSAVYGPSLDDPTKIVLRGNLRTFAERSPAKRVATVYLISPEPIGDNFRVSPVTAKCWTQLPTDPVPSNTFTPIS